MARSTSKQVVSAIRAHILESVRNCDEMEDKSEFEVVQHVLNEFERVAGYPANKIRFTNQQERFSDYLSGLPFGFDFTYFDIRNRLESFGLDRRDDIDDDKTTKHYHYLIYREVLAMARKHKATA